MSTITRDDGIVFSVYTYREILSAKRSSLRREAALIASENGGYTRFFPLQRSQVEAVFSFDKGYLLAELVWDYFGNPSNLIFCESIPETQHAILIVVRGDSVYFDGYLPLNNLQDEFLSLSLTQENQYRIYIYGQIPLAESPTEEMFAFDAELVESFEVLDSPVFANLPINDDYLLLPLDQAIDEHFPAKLETKKLVLIGGAGIILLAVFWYLLFGGKQKKQPQISRPVRIEHVVSVQPYQDYQRVLSKPTANDIVHQVLASAFVVSSITGWQATNLSYKDASDQLSFKVTSDGGSTRILLDWVKANRDKAKMTTLSSAGASLDYTVNLKSRAPTTVIYPIEDITSTLYDNLKRLFITVSLSSNFVSDGDYKKAKITVSFSGASPFLLNLFAKELTNYPVVLDSFNLSINNGLFSGSISLEVLGR